MVSRLIIIACLALSAYARTTSGTKNAIPEESGRSEESPYSFLGDLKYAFKVYQECASADMSTCLKLKLIGAIDRVARSQNTVSITEGISFVKENEINTEETKTVAEIEATLPRALTEKNEALNAMIFDKMAKFFEGHSLQVKFPSASELAEESRGKKKKLGGLLMLPLVLGGTLVPLALGALALLAGKALVVSKLALVLAAIIGLKKLLSGGHGGIEAPHEVQYSHGSGWGRSYLKEQAQNMAYNAYAPKSR